jgi:uncharacterized protein (DUF924 family)
MISADIMLDALAQSIVDFWFVPRAGESGAGNAMPPGERVTRDVWFRKDDAFDAEIRERFGVALAAGLAGAFGHWCREPLGCLARVILLDQFTRNAFRGTPRAFAGDPGALATAEDALERAFDRSLAPQERWFLYMPFVHSESLARQERGVALFEALAGETGLDEPLPWAIRHRDVIRRFGRFPHRNEILGRASTPEEIAFLQEPGSRF